MRVACPTCHSEYNVDERRVPAGGVHVRCPGCQRPFPVRPPPADTWAVPLPGGEAGESATPPAGAGPDAEAGDHGPGATLRYEAPAPASDPLPTDDRPERTSSFDPPPVPDELAPGEGFEMLFDEPAPAAALPPSAAAAPTPPSPPSRADSPAPPPMRRGGYEVRRRSGKVFGPFPEPEIVEMLGKGELLGNEEVSSDGGETFVAIGAVPAFGETMRRLMGAAPPSRPPVVRAGGAPRASLASLREARLLERAQALFAAHRGACIAAAAAGVVLALGAGTALGTHGAFFYRDLVGRRPPSGAVAQLVADARARLAEDRFASGTAGVDLAARAVALEPRDPAAQATYVLAVTLLAARDGAPADALARARTLAAELTPRAAEDAQVAEAVVSAALLAGQRPLDAGLLRLQQHLAKSPADEEALAALGAAALARRDLDQAAALYGRLEAARPAARAAHALGLVAAARADLAGAQARFTAALQRDPRHLASAVELARAALAAGDLAGAREAAGRVLAPEAQPDAGPFARARAHALVGEALARAVGDDVERAMADAERELEVATREAPDDVEAHLALAAFERAHGSPEKTLAALATLGAAAARDARVVAAQALAAAAQGRVLDALTTLDRGLADAPGDAHLLLAKGTVLWQSGKRGEGEKLWADAAARAPSAAGPHLALGQASLASGDLDRADRELAAAVEKDPRSAAVHVARGDLLLARGDLAGAEESYRRAVALDAGDAGALLGQARLADRRGDGPAARSALERALRLDARLAAAQAFYGELSWRAGDRAAARRALSQAVALDGHDARARARLGTLELEAGEVDAAVSDLLAATNLDGGSAVVRAAYGRALAARGELSAAIEQLRKAVELEPRSADHPLELAKALDRQGSAAEALEALRAAQALAPQRVDVLELLAAAYAGQNRCAEALPLLERAQRLAPREQRLRVSAGECQERLGHHEEAIALYRRALKEDPSQVSLYYRIGRAEREAGRPREALPWFERAAQAEPRNPTPHYYLGFAYKERGQPARAVAAFRAYLAARPEADDRQDIQREIEDLGGKP